MAIATRPPPVNRGYYAESSQARPLTTGDLGPPTAHIRFPHIVFQMCSSTFAVLGVQATTSRGGE